MREPGQPVAAALLLGLRTPLSRVALAAGQLAREVVTPAQSALAGAISDAVRDLDAEIDRILPMLVRVGPSHEASTDLRGVLAELRARVGPGLEARGIRWLRPGVELARVEGDPHVTRRCAVELLRAGAAWAGPGGSVRLETQSGEKGAGLSVESVPAEGEALREPLALLASLEALAASHGAVLEDRCVPDGVGLTLWLPSAP